MAAAIGLGQAAVAQGPVVDEPDWQRARAVWFATGDTPAVAAEICVGWSLSNGKLASVAVPTSLGTDLWAVLETFTPLQFGDVQIGRGRHPLLLEQNDKGAVLVLLDDARLRSSGAPAGAPPQPLPVVARVPLAAAAGAGGAVRMSLQAGDGTVALSIRCAAGEFRAEAKVPAAKGAFPLDQPMERHASRLAFGKVRAVLDHGMPKWSPETAAALAAMAVGDRWRLGNDWWTTLDLDGPVKLGGKKLVPGNWQLALEKTKAGWNLLCCPAGDHFADALDAFAAQRCRPQVVVPLAVGKDGDVAETLRIGFTSERGKCRLAIAFGPHRLSTDIGDAKGLAGSAK